MRIYIGAVAALFASTILPTDAKAGWKSGNELYAQCKSSTSYDTGQCYGYLAGVLDGSSETELRIVIAELGEAEPTFHYVEFCLRNGVTFGQIKDVVVRYLERHPETRDKGAAELVVTSLIEAFPCPK